MAASVCFNPLLLLISSDHWRKNIPVLAKSHRVYSIDLIGYGYSDKPNPRDFGDQPFYTFETWGAQLNDFCTEVVKDQAFFICNSIGGDHLLLNVLHYLRLIVFYICCCLIDLLVRHTKNKTKMAVITYSLGLSKHANIHVTIT